MARLVFIEGPEGSGKSTLAQQLQRDWLPKPSLIVKASGQGSTEPELVYNMLGIFRHLSDDYKVIWDRCWLSDFAYQELLGRPSQWTQTQAWDLEQELVEGGAEFYLLPLSYADKNARTKVGVLVAEEEDAYQGVAAPWWYWRVG